MKPDQPRFLMTRDPTLPSRIGMERIPLAIIDSEGNPMGYGDTQAGAIQNAAEALGTDAGTVEAMLAKDQGPDCFLWADGDWFARWLEINPNETWGK